MVSLGSFVLEGIFDASGSEQLRGQAPLRLRHPSEQHSPGRAAVWQLWISMGYVTLEATL